jgi:uncharacterized protein
MPIDFALSLSPAIAGQEVLLKEAVAQSMNLSPDVIQTIRVNKRSIDARKRQVLVNLQLSVYINEEVPELSLPALPEYPDVRHAQEVVIVGAGPAGLFAALILLERGLKPIILERGKDVRGRRRDLAILNREHVVDPDSNYCFGEGGAGTYSDGKLYTRSKKRGDTRKVLELLVAFGASPDILIEAHPHVGTNKLPEIIQAIRERIIAQGGEVHFEKRVSDLMIKAGAIEGVVCADGDRVQAKAVLLATGHSARDVFELLHQHKIEIQAKPFALGVRVEHPQSQIDQIQYHLGPQDRDRGPWLPPAPYNITRQVGGRGVYSFCMCPGGIIAPCATSPGEVVTNGWSPSKRDQPWANSGIVVEVRPEDWIAFDKTGPLAAMHFQASVEKNCWKAGGETQKVPAQRLTDFVSGRRTEKLGASSYLPGTTPAMLHRILPPFLSTRLREGFKYFGQALRGYLSEEAIVHAPESRTSSPVRIPRDPITLQHPGMTGLYPCGEGAGYAGGIVSAAIDGMGSAEQIAQWVLQASPSAAQASSRQSAP